MMARFLRSIAAIDLDVARLAVARAKLSRWRGIFPAALGIVAASHEFRHLQMDIWITTGIPINIAMYARYIDRRIERIGTMLSIPAFKCGIGVSVNDTP